MAPAAAATLTAVRARVPRSAGPPAGLLWGALPQGQQLQPERTLSVNQTVAEEKRTVNLENQKPPVVPLQF